MMKVWRFEDDATNFKRIRFVDDVDGREFIRSFDGNSKISNWIPPKLVFEPEDINKPQGDFTHLLSGFFVVNSKCADLFEKHFGNTVELLPIDSVVELYIVNILDVSKYVDYDNSSIKYYPDSKKILRIKKFAFLEFALQDKYIFKDDGFPITDVYATDEAKKIVEGWDVTGVNFIELWNSTN